MNRAWEYPGDRFCSPDGSAGRGAAGDEVAVGLVRWGAAGDKVVVDWRMELVGCRETAGDEFARLRSSAR